MKYTTILGLLLLVIGLVFSIYSDVSFDDSEFIAGALTGAGAGLLLGGLLAYSTKKTKVITKEIVATNVTPRKPVTVIDEKDDSGLKL